MEKLAPEMQEFERKRIEAARQFAKRKPGGEIEASGPNIQLANPEAYNEALAALRKKYHPAIAAHEKARKEIDAHLKEKEETDIHKVPFDLLPETISPVILEALEPMIEKKGLRRGPFPVPGISPISSTLRFGLFVESPLWQIDHLAALLKNGGVVTIDAEKNTLDADLTEAEIAARFGAWKAPAYKVTQGTLYKYIKTVSDASQGCVTDE